MSTYGLKGEYAWLDCEMSKFVGILLPQPFLYPSPLYQTHKDIRLIAAPQVAPSVALHFMAFPKAESSALIIKKIKIP